MSLSKYSVDFTLLKGEKCVICGEMLLYDEPEAIARSDGCPHLFHLSCYKGWLIRKATCPVCASKVENLVVYKNEEDISILKGKRKVKNKTQDQIIRDLKCMVCDSGADEDKLLICENCEQGFHTYCIGISKKPSEMAWHWQCNKCLHKKNLLQKDWNFHGKTSYVGENKGNPVKSIETSDQSAKKVSEDLDVVNFEFNPKRRRIIDKIFDLRPLSSTEDTNELNEGEKSNDAGRNQSKQKQIEKGKDFEEKDVSAKDVPSGHVNTDIDKNATPNKPIAPMVEEKAGHTSEMEVISPRIKQQMKIRSKQATMSIIRTYKSVWDKPHRYLLMDKKVNRENFH